MTFYCLRKEELTHFMMTVFHWLLIWSWAGFSHDFYTQVVFCWVSHTNKTRQMQAMKPTLGKTVEAHFELRVSVVVSKVICCRSSNRSHSKQKKTKVHICIDSTAFILCLLVNSNVISRVGSKALTSLRPTHVTGHKALQSHSRRVAGEIRKETRGWDELWGENASNHTPAFTFFFFFIIPKLQSLMTHTCEHDVKVKSNTLRIFTNFLLVPVLGRLYNLHRSSALIHYYFSHKWTMTTHSWTPHLIGSLSKHTGSISWHKEDEIKSISVSLCQPRFPQPPPLTLIPALASAAQPCSVSS